jgi:hypothetical protein
VARKLFLILLALVLALSVGLVACTGSSQAEQEEEEEPPEPTMVKWGPYIHGTVTFSQLQWMASPEEARYPSSNVGEVEFTFLEGAGDWLLGNEDSGGGWLNVVIDTSAAGGMLQWAVQNLYLVYPDMNYLLGSTPSVQFSLGLNNETAIGEGELEAAVFLSHEPLEEQPQAEELVPYSVSSMPYLVGGENGGGSGYWDTPHTIGSFNGSSAPVANSAWLCIPVSEVAEIDEGHCGCTPGAVARSISYLGGYHKLTIPSPQDIYTQLVSDMGTQIGGNGTNHLDGLIGKNNFCTSRNLAIESERIYTDTFHPDWGESWHNLIWKVRDALKECCGVELGYQVWNWTGTENEWKAIGGHTAMITSVTIKDLDFAEIWVVDDHQGDKLAENREYAILTNHLGKILNFGKNITITNFVFECYKK